MRPLRYSINVTLDGCFDHRHMVPDEDLHRNATENLAWADALIFGRVIYQMMENGWRGAGSINNRPAWMEPFAQTIDSAKKYVVSRTLTQVDWNAELVSGEVLAFVHALKQQPGSGLLTGGVTLPFALAEAGLIDEYELVVHPSICGHGPALFAGLTQRLNLQLKDQKTFRSGAVALRYVPGIVS
ncbi:MAG: dihydrofolate reductase family protein [Acidobacteria bacterium]|nr:dihydrofolate reductase family protein [Acidobacteriota bacterium]MCB9399664.1 dihydrofolate reductase family protein [Acidobacteriota bacterium]